MVICYQCEFPEIVRDVAIRDAVIVLVTTAGGKDWKEVQKFIIPARTYENGIFMAYANYSNAENGHGFCGLCCIVEPGETSLARAGPTEEIIFANIDISLAAKAREKYHFSVISKVCFPIEKVRAHLIDLEQKCAKQPLVHI